MNTGIGKVKFFNESKGYGFITDATDPTKDYFFHYTKSIDKVKKDEHVTYTIEQGKKGLQAVDVKRIV
jgi:cold shock protein